MRDQWYIRYEILGPLRLRLGNAESEVTGVRTRVLLAMLLLGCADIVPTEQLIDALWDDAPPNNARNLLQVCVSRLRRRLRRFGAPEDVIVTEPAGYRIAIADGSLDLVEFRRLRQAAQAASASDGLQTACDGYRAALALWRGPALAGIDSQVVRQAATALEEERLSAHEECIDCELAAGHSGRLVAELTSLVERHPFRERLHGALMLALYRQGRQADALAVFRRVQELLDNELGVAPGHDLRRLHKSILQCAPELGVRRAPSPSQSPPGPIPRELPPDVVDFTGRKAALQELDELLAAWVRAGCQAQTIVVAGSAGVGKTALALHWAHSRAAMFPDGQLHVNLGGYTPGPPLSPSRALAAMLRSLGTPPDQIPVDEAQAASLYRTSLAGRRVLVVLDNARSAKQVRPLLPGSPGALVLVTSRDRLAGLVARDGARRLTLNVFSALEAVTLLARRLGHARASTEPTAVAELAEACADLPLALSVAVAGLANRPRQTISRYVADHKAGDRLSALQVDDDEASALRATFELSYQRIPPEAQRLFRLLGLIPGPDITPSGAAALAGTTLAQARRWLNLLAGAHLIQEHTAGRYAFHDLLRRYARERAEQDESEQVRRDATVRLLRWYAAGAMAAAGRLYPDHLQLPGQSVSEEPPPDLR